MAVSDEVIIAELHKLLEDVDWDNTTERMLRNKLESVLGVSLQEKKQLISVEIDKYLSANEDKIKAADDAGGDVEDEPEEEKPRPKKASKASKKRKAADEEEGVKKRKAPTQKPCLLSPELQAFLGEESLPRTQVVKKIWEYIKANNLQDPQNKRSIICDEKMRTIFKPPIDMFNMNKQLSNHIKNASDVA